MAIDKEKLLASVSSQEEVEIPGKGTVVVRALTRAEIHSNAQGDKKSKLSNEDVEARTIVFGLVEPELDINEAKQWMKAAPAGEIQLVVEKIMELSGYGEDAVNKAYERFRD